MGRSPSQQRNRKGVDSFKVFVAAICVIAIPGSIVGCYRFILFQGEDFKDVLLFANSSLLFLLTIFAFSLRSRIKKDYSVFISYSSKDKDFARGLHADLKNRGIYCWFAAEDLQVGDFIWKKILEMIFDCDKLLVILSENSVNSTWVKREVETALGKSEANLFPIRLDNSVLTSDTEWAARIRDEIYIGDFTHWKNSGKYKLALDRLIRDLRPSA